MQTKLALYSHHPYKILILGGSGLGKTNVLLNLIKHQQTHVDQIYIVSKNYLSMEKKK